MTTDGDSIAVELAELRGCMENSFTRVEGSLKLIADRAERTQGDVGKMDDRVKALEERRWPLASVGILAGAVSAAVAALPFLAR